MAFDLSHNASDTISSNGVVSDQEGPEAGYVIDGLESDNEWVISDNILQASWGDFSDPLSGLASHE